jgi:hypothetical protein
MKKALGKKVSGAIKEWVGANKKVFWKYEVTSFYRSYVISVANLPAPTHDDIRVLSNNRLLTETQKNQLCRAIKKACPKIEEPANFNVNVKVDYEKGQVVAAII